MVEERQDPLLYLDTNALLDVVDNRRQATIQLYDRIIKRNWQMIASPFAVLEMIEAKQADRWAEKMVASGFTFFQIQRRVGARRTGRDALTRQELNEVYESLHAAMLTRLPAVTFPTFTEGLQNRAEDVCASTNLDAADSLHLATALHYGCDILITSDSDFVRLARPYVIATTPDGFDRAFEEFDGHVEPR